MVRVEVENRDGQGMPASRWGGAVREGGEGLENRALDGNT